jgi:CelD/BcsL family acetyltransferase involved in cellulose biosynthesis
MTIVRTAPDSEHHPPLFRAAAAGGLMGYQVETLNMADIDPAMAAAWDALPPARGTQADFHDSHAWLTSWAQARDPALANRLRIPAVLAGGQPVALLPLEVRRRGHWESAAASAINTHRQRYRPVLEAEAPDEEALGLLVDQVARAGVRELALNRLPARDPATHALVDALRRGGFAVATRERSSDCLAIVDGGWAEHRHRFSSYDRSVRTKAKRLRSLWEVRLCAYGDHDHGASPPTDGSLADGFAAYEDLHRRSWKDPWPVGFREERLALLHRTDQLGWSRFFVLWVADVPAAAHIWFRVGEVATWLSTAYDQRLAAASPGSILMWWAQERLFAESPPRLVDYLPGDNPQKGRLSPDRSPLLLVEAARRTMVSGVTFPLRRRANDVLPRARGRLRRRAGKAPDPRPPSGTRRVEAAPDADAGLAATPLELDTALRRALAVLGGHVSPEAMSREWGDGDSWWLVGRPPKALVRLGAIVAAVAPVLELVLLEPDGVAVEAMLGTLAAAVGTSVRAELPADASDGGPGTPIPVRRAVLPWPRSLLSARDG